MKYNKRHKYSLAIRRLYGTKHPSKELISLLGIDKEGFIKHINKYLLKDIDLEGFGKTWGLDHIVPVDLFNLEDTEDLKLCYNYNNIMPMFIKDNRLKGASVHFSLVKLDSMDTNVYIERLKAKCHEQIVNVYNKYLCQ